MARFVEEEGLEKEEKVEGVRGMLEGVVDPVRRSPFSEVNEPKVMNSKSSLIPG